MNITGYVLGKLLAKFWPLCGSVFFSVRNGSKRLFECLFTSEFKIFFLILVIFSTILLDSLLSMLNHSFENGILPQSLREANISLILKKKENARVAATLTG